MKTALSIVCIAPKARLMEDFLADLADRWTIQAGGPLEALIAGKAEDLSPSLRTSLRERGILARFLEPCRESVYTRRDWIQAITAAQSAWIMHADEYTRFFSASGLSHNLGLLKASPKDMLHFKARFASTPSPGDLHGKAILFFFLNTVFSALESPNKIYARPLCMKACGELERLNRASDAAEAVFLHLMLASLAEEYSGIGLGVTECRIPTNDMEYDARQAAALYKALETLPGYFKKLGHPEESIQLAKYRLRAEFTLALGRVCRTSGVTDPEANDVARRALLRFFSKEDVLDTLLLGTAQNAKKIVEIYRVIYEDTVFDPCHAYGIQKHPVPRPACCQAGEPNG